MSNFYGDRPRQLGDETPQSASNKQTNKKQRYNIETTAYYGNGRSN